MNITEIKKIIIETLDIECSGRVGDLAYKIEDIIKERDELQRQLNNAIESTHSLLKLK